MRKSRLNAWNIWTGIFFLLLQNCTNPYEKPLHFPAYPEMKIGFSTQSFMNSFPFSVETIHSLLEYAHEEGFQFIELRDAEAQLEVKECKDVAKKAAELGIEVIYEIDVNLLHPQFDTIFKRGVRNILEFGAPGILRAAITRSEFAHDSSRVGWSMEEVTEAAVVAERCAEECQKQGITFVVENLTEPFFGNAPHYYGLSDLFDHTELVGLQFDLCNPFASISRKEADPDHAASYLNSLGNRWVTTHIKTCRGGMAQPVLGENPLSIQEVTQQMGESGVNYFSLELADSGEGEECYKNVEKSIDYLRRMEIISR